MSDSGDDIDDELFALATSNTDKKRKKRSGTSSKGSKKRKADMTDSEDDGEDNPYPLEGKYTDEADRQRLMQMSEMEREEILASRMELIEKANMKRQLQQMVRDQHGSASDSVSRAAKRPHTARGATTEKTKKLDELKAKRKARDQKHRGSPRRDRSSSPMDMDISDDESEEGQFTKDDEEEERAGKLLNRSPVDQPLGVQDLEKVRLTRNNISKHYLAPWFQDYVQDAWVRYLVGNDNGHPVYRIAQITSLGSDLVKPYKINDQTANQMFELKHGKSVRLFPMDKVSNAPFEKKEFERLEATCLNEDVKLPTPKQVRAKAAQLHKLVNQPVTESDINAMIARRNELSAAQRPAGLSTIEKSRLNQARTLALRRHDHAEVAEIDAKLAEIAANSMDRPRAEDTAADLLAKVNERNRKANLEAVRKAELAEAERKRKERKMHASGTATPVDPSARLKTIPKVFNAATPTTRPGTPSAGNNGISESSPTKEKPINPLPPSSLSNSRATKTFEASVIESIEIDLGDF